MSELLEVEQGASTELTLAPSDASLYATAAPIPRAAPVTIAFFPSRGKPVTLVLSVLVIVEGTFGNLMCGRVKVNCSKAQLGDVCSDEWR